MKHQLIGLSGTFAGGKDTLVNHINETVTHVSTGDLVREVARERYGSIERDVLQKTATECRHESGAGVFVERAIAKPERPMIISGIRSLGEMQAVRDAGGVIVFVDAPVELRYERMKARARDKEIELTLEEFIEREKKELYGDINDPAAFNIAAIKERADSVIENDSTLEALYERASEVFGTDFS